VRLLHRLAAAQSAVLLFAFFPFIQAASADESGSDDCELPGGLLDQQELPAGSDVVECGAVDRLVASSDNLVIQIPAPGNSITMTTTEYDGAGSAFAVRVANDGTISYTEPAYIEGSGAASVADEQAIEDELDPELFDEDTRAASPTSACNRSTFTRHDTPLAGNYVWFLGDGKRPMGLTDGFTAGVMFDALNTIVSLRNPCGVGGSLSVGWSYGGVDSRESDFTLSDGRSVCSNDPDSVSTVDFGDLANNGNPAVAMACRWNYRGEAYQSDVRFNTTDYNFTRYPRNSNCDDRFDLQSVATHEFGHTFGLRDLPNFDDRYLTMYKSSFRCRALARTLGRGDALGLRGLY